MSNEKYIGAVDRVIEYFKNDFIGYSREQFTLKDTGKLAHPGEFGASREKICEKLFNNFIPSSRGIKTRGFIINSNDETSKEQDIIFYSPNDTPILTLENSNFFPITIYHYFTLF